MSDAPERGPRPPDPPGIDRRIHLRRSQLVGMAIVVLVPLLAIAGLFGDSWEDVEASSASLRTEVHYPNRTRYRLSGLLTIRVENRGDVPSDTVEVDLDPAYVDQFADVDIVPSPGRDYRVSLTDVRPGEQRRVVMRFAPAQYGRHRGRIVVRANADSIVVPIETLVLP